MPLDGYYEGDGEKVMKSMTKSYGEKKGKSVFYVTANKMKNEGKKGMKPPVRKKNPRKKVGR